ncbi:putative small metal-binding protein [Staphylococcus cohnii]
MATLKGMIYVLTVKQLSDKLNVSKQTINNNVPNDMSYKKIKGINYIDEQLEIAITNNINRNKNRFSYDSTQSEDIQHENTSSSDELVKQLRSEIELLHNQLTIKDNQIEQITKALTNQQSLQLEHYRNYELDNTTQNISSNNESDTQDVSNTSDLNSNDISYKDNDEVHTHDEKATQNVRTPKKKSLLSRLFNK